MIRYRPWAVFLVVVFLTGLFPLSAALGAVLQWQDTGTSLWLDAGSGLDLSTGTAGEDLVLTGTHVTSQTGLAVVPGARNLSQNVLVPTGDYSSSLKVDAVENKVVIIKLANGGYAQVSFGMGWLGGRGYSSLQINGWYTAAAAAPPPPADDSSSDSDYASDSSGGDSGGTVGIMPQFGPIKKATLAEGDLGFSFTEEALVPADQADLVLKDGKLRGKNGTTLSYMGPYDGLTAIYSLRGDGYKEAAGAVGESRVWAVRLGDGRYAKLIYTGAWEHIEDPFIQLASFEYAVEPGGTPRTSSSRSGRLEATSQNGTVVLKWDAFGTPVNEYVIYRSSTRGQDGERYRMADTNKFVDDNVEAGQTYFYRVEAWRGNRKAAATNEASATVTGSQERPTFPVNPGPPEQSVWLRPGVGFSFAHGKEVPAAQADLILEDSKLVTRNGAAITIFKKPIPTRPVDRLPLDHYGPEVGADTYAFDYALRLADGRYVHLHRYDISFDGEGEVDGFQVHYTRPAAPDEATAPVTTPAAPAPRGQAVRLQVGNRTARVGSQETTLDVPPQILDGRTMVPLRFLGEALGATLNWDGGERRITLTAGSRTVLLWVDRPQGQVNGSPVNLDVPPTIVDGRTLVPLRFISENLGARLTWNAADKSIELTPEGASAPPVTPAPTPAPAPTPDPAPVTGEPPNTAVPAAACPYNGAGAGLADTLRLSFRPAGFLLRPDCTAWVYEKVNDQLQPTLHLLRLSDGSELASIGLPTDFVASLNYNPVNNVVYWMNAGGKVTFYDGSTGTAQGELTVPRAEWWDIPNVTGSVIDPQTGRLFIYQSDGFWVVDAGNRITGPFKVNAGEGGIGGAVVRGQTLWLLGRPWNNSPAVAVPVRLDTLQAGPAGTLLPAGALNFALGFAMDVQPDTGTFYVSGTDSTGPFVASVRYGQVLQWVYLKGFLQTPVPTLSPDGQHIALRDPGVSGVAVTDREYSYDSIKETYKLFSVDGSLVIANSTDLGTVTAMGTGLTEVRPDWYVSDAGKPAFAVFSPDSRVLFVGDPVSSTIRIFRTH